MTIKELLLKQMDEERPSTRKILERVPVDQFGWKPHEKSMTLLQLATHIAELPSWAAMAFTMNELDFETTPYELPPINTTEDLLNLFEKSSDTGKKELENATDESLDEKWILRSGEVIHAEMTRADVVRVSHNQIAHHRGQLGVYLRLLNIPVPGVYGPSADEMAMSS